MPKIFEYLGILMFFYSNEALPLKGKDLKDFEEFLDKFADKIVEKWVTYFIYHKEVDFERITRRLK
jgi:hypothetical protein